MPFSAVHCALSLLSLCIILPLAVCPLRLDLWRNINRTLYKKVEIIRLLKALRLWSREHPFLAGLCMHEISGMLSSHQIHSRFSDILFILIVISHWHYCNFC